MPSRVARSSRLAAALVGLALTSGTGIIAQTAQNKAVHPQRPRRPRRATTTSRAQVKQWTTRPDFISPLVDHLPKTPACRVRKTFSATISARRTSSPTTPTSSLLSRARGEITARESRNDRQEQ